MHGNNHGLGQLGTSDGANAMWGWFLERMGGSR